MAYLLRLTLTLQEPIVAYVMGEREFLLHCMQKMTRVDLRNFMFAYIICTL